MLALITKDIRAWLNNKHLKDQEVKREVKADLIWVSQSRERSTRSLIL
jgi:hypothetical protein